MERCGGVSWASEAEDTEEDLILEQEHTPSTDSKKDDESTKPRQMVEIQLGEELLGILSRRSRRRVRDIQASCKVRARLDEIHGMLQVTGSESGIRREEAAGEPLRAPEIGPKSSMGRAHANADAGNDGFHQCCDDAERDGLPRPY